jgi:hypothetical protein
MHTSFHFTSGNIFVFKPVPYSLTYAVKYFISTRGKKGQIKAVTSSTVSFSTLVATLVIWLSVGSKQFVSRQLPASSSHNRYCIMLNYFFYIFNKIYQEE